MATRFTNALEKFILIFNDVYFCVRMYVNAGRSQKHQIVLELEL